MIEIKILITDKDTLKEYADVHTDLIIDDFVNDPDAWINLVGTKIEVKRIEED
jgi:hypothetical protein